MTRLLLFAAFLFCYSSVAQPLRLVVPTGHTAPLKKVLYNTDGKLLDGSTAFINVTPDRYFQCSPDAARLLHYVNGLEVIGFNQLNWKQPQLTLHIQARDSVFAVNRLHVWVNECPQTAGVQRGSSPHQRYPTTHGPA